MTDTPRWKWALGWVITPIFLTLFLETLCVFHVLQVVTGPISRRFQKRVLDGMNFSIIFLIRFVTRASYRTIGTPLLDESRPVILVANHQSMYDIPMIMWLYRRREVAFIAKRELSRGIPSVSYALRTLGSAIIDRKDTKQAVEAIEELGHRKERQKQVACIFPEGTRARDGVMRRFRSTGLLTMVRSMPTACIQPVVVDGNWELLRYKFLPVPVFTRIRLELLDPIEPSHYSSTELVEVVERTIRGRLGQLQEAKAGTAA